MAYITPLAATHEADTSDAHDASAVSILDTAGDFTATDVEGALAELQSDAEAHLTDSSDAHDASAISITDSGGYFTGTDVEAALQELGAASGGGGMTLLVKSADETVNGSATLQNDDELLFAVGASETWQFEGVLFCTSGGTPNFKIAATGPSGSVGRLGVVVTSGAWSVEGDTEDLGTGISVTSPAGNPAVVHFYGAIANGANAGNLTIQWAQNTSDASNTIVHAGSYIKYQEQV